MTLQKLGLNISAWWKISERFTLRSFPDQTKASSNTPTASLAAEKKSKSRNAPRLDGALVVDSADEGTTKCLEFVFVAIGPSFRPFHSRCSYSSWCADWLANIGGGNCVKRWSSLGLRGVLCLGIPSKRTSPGSCDEVDGQPVPEEEVGKATKVRIQLCFLFKVLVWLSKNIILTPTLRIHGD